MIACGGMAVVGGASMAAEGMYPALRDSAEKFDAQQRLFRLRREAREKATAEDASSSGQ